MPDLYFLSVDTNNAKTTVMLNDVPLVTSADGDGVKTEKPITTWIMPGKNSLRIVLKALPNQETVSGSAEVTLYLQDNASEFPKVKDVLASIVFPGDKEVTAKTLQIDEAVEFEFTAPQSFKLWHEAQTVTQLTGSDKQQMADYLRALQNALTSNDEKTAVDLQMYKIHEDAVAENKDPQDLVEVTKSNYSWLASQGTLSATQIDLSKLVFNVVSQGKLVHVVNPNGTDVVHLESSDMVFEIPAFFANVGGKWVLAR